MGERQDWHPADIKAALEKAGWTLKALALASGYSKEATHCAINHRPWPAMKRKIAEAVGRRPHEIWPSLFDNFDRVRSDRYRLKASTMVRRRNVYRGEAA